MDSSKIHDEMPEGYSSYVEVCMVFFHCQGKYLLLKRSESEELPNTWGAPGGCLEPGETPLEALIREADEELSYTLEPDKAQFIKTFYIEKDPAKKRGHFLHMFYAEVETPFTPELNEEHSEFRWLAWEEAEKLPLISGKGPAMQIYQAALEERAPQV